MKLYYSPGACSLSPHIVAREAGLQVDTSRVTFDGAKRTTAEGEDFFVVNIKGGYVPTLRLDDNSILTEGVAIVQYLADQSPDKKLMPAQGSKEYYQELELLTFISSELHKGFSPLFNPNLPEEQKTTVVDKLKKRYAYLDSTLTDKQYVLGDSFSVADAYLYTILRWSPRAGITFGEYPNLAAFMIRMDGRAGVQAALKEEGLEAFPVA